MAMPELDPPEPQELLEMRLVALCQDIDKVKQVAGDAARRRTSLDRLDHLICRYDPDSVWVQLQESNSLIMTLVEVMNRDPELKESLYNHGLLDNTLEMVQRLGTIRDRLGEARTEVSTMRESMVDTSQDTALTISLTERCRKLGREVEALLAELRAEGDPREVWARYERKLENECQELFADYVDFLGGLTMRDHALDDEVCAITDGLLDEIPRQPKRLSLPARPTLHSAFNELVKLGFPGWTIWNIPLVGAEIGATQARKPFGDFVSDQVKHGLPEPVCRALFAEAYAAYTVGPAYGCAATLLKFQPNHDKPGKEKPSDLQRAAVILRVLRVVADDLPEIGQVVERIEEYWLEAVSRLDSDTTAIATDRLDEFSDAVVEALQAYEGPFGPEVWGSVDRTVELLRESARPHRAPTGLSARVLLNAAWVTRLDRPGSKEWAHDVTTNVKALWKSMSLGGKRGRP